MTKIIIRETLTKTLNMSVILNKYVKIMFTIHNTNNSNNNNT